MKLFVILSPVGPYFKVRLMIGGSLLLYLPPFPRGPPEARNLAACRFPPPLLVLFARYDLLLMFALILLLLPLCESLLEVSQPSPPPPPHSLCFSATFSTGGLQSDQALRGHGEQASLARRDGVRQGRRQLRADHAAAGSGGGRPRLRTGVRVGWLGRALTTLTN